MKHSKVSQENEFYCGNNFSMLTNFVTPQTEMCAILYVCMGETGSTCSRRNHHKFNIATAVNFKSSMRALVIPPSSPRLLEKEPKSTSYSSDISLLIPHFTQSNAGFIIIAAIIGGARKVRITFNS